MADENEYDIYDDIDVEGSDPTDEELDEAGFSGSFGGATAEELEEIYGGLQEQLRKRQETIDQYGLDETASLGQEGDEFLSTYESKMQEAKRAAARRASGLTGDRIFEYAERLKDIAEGRRKTEGQIEAEKQLAILSQAQRGRAMGLGGFAAIIFAWERKAEKQDVAKLEKRIRILEQKLVRVQALQEAKKR